MISRSGPQRGTRILVFLAITYAVTWACFIAVAARWAASSMRGAIVLLGAFAPSLVALSLTALDEGEAGVRVLLSRVGQWRVPVRYYVFAITYMAVIKLTVALVYRVAMGVWPRFGTDPWYILPAALVLSTPFQAGEEIGWRGYALPRLAGRFGLPAASLVLGLIWALWHLPQFFIPEADTYRQSFLVFALQVTAMSVALAWLWAETRGSLLLPMLLHAATNNTKDIVPSAVAGAADPFSLNASFVGWLTVAALWVGALYFLVRMHRRNYEICAQSP